MCVDPAKLDLDKDLGLCCKLLPYVIKIIFCFERELPAVVIRFRGLSGFGRLCAAGALRPPNTRRALSYRAGMNPAIARAAVPVSDQPERPHSRGLRASMVRWVDPADALLSRADSSQDCRGLRAPAFFGCRPSPSANSYSSGRTLTSAPAGERDGRAPVPTGCAIVASLPAAALGSPAVGRLFAPRARLRLQAIGSRAPVCVPASSSYLPHPTHPVASIFLKHGGLTECGQSRGVAA